jgi:uncharacterized protein YjbI with pentapeptide repeats
MLWHHVAATYNSVGGIMKIYIDGALVTSVSDATKGQISADTTASVPVRLVIGSDAAALPSTTQFQTDRQFRGFISDVRLWKVERTAAEIFNNYKQRLNGNEANLMGYWKLNQGYGSGWGTYSIAVDSTTYRNDGTLRYFATPSSNWVLTDITFNPRISSVTLGAKNGLYSMADSSFSFIDPTSNSLGLFSYSINNSNATITDGSATTKIIYSNMGPISIPTVTTYGFPILADMPNWQIDMAFTVTGGSGTWRALMGDMYNNITVSDRGWGLWVSSYNTIWWSWLSNTIQTPYTVSINTPYLLTVKATNNGTTISMNLKNLVLNTTQTDSQTISGISFGRGPVTIGGWRVNGSNGAGAGEVFPGIISYVTVSVPTVNRNVTLSSASPAIIKAIQSPLFDFASGSTTVELNNGIIPTISAFTDISKNDADVSFALTIPTSNSAGEFSFTSSATNVATIIPGISVNALNFDGANDYIDLGSNITELGGASFTIECWMKTSGKSMGLVNYQDQDNPPFWEQGEKSFYIDSAGVPAFVGFGNNFIYSNQVINDNAWHHCAVVWNYSGSGASGTGKMYVDGQDTTNSKLTFNGTSTSKVSIPSGINIGSNDFTIEWYQYQTDNNSWPRVFEFGNRNPMINYELSTGSIQWFSGGSSSPIFSVNFGTYKNVWVHVAVVRISGLVTLYKNGEPIISNFVDSTNFTSNTSLTIGNETTSNAISAFGGSIRYFHIINGVGKYTGLFTPSTVMQTVTANSLLLINTNSTYQGSLSGSVVASNVTVEPYNSSLIYSATFNNSVIASSRFVVGVPNNSESTNYFIGSLCELRIWNVARTSSQIYQNFRRILNGNETGLVAYLRLNQGSANGSNTSVTTAANNKLTGGYSGTLYNFSLLGGSNSNWVSGITLRPVNDVTIVAAGTTIITASQSQSGVYYNKDVSASLIVTSTSILTPTLSNFLILPANIGDPAFNLTPPTSNSSGSFTYTSSNTAVATISANTFTSSNLLARYDSSVSSYYTLSGSNVTQWNDLTGNGYHLTSNGTGPTLSSINSIPALDFNSSKGLLRSAVPLNNTVTIFMVIKYSTNIGTWGSFMHHGDRDSDWCLERNSWTNASTPHNIQFQSNKINGTTELSTTNGVNYILIGRISGSTREFWRYSDTEASGFATGSGVSIVTGNKSIYVGKSDNGESCNSIIGEILYYNTSISDANIKTNLKYLQNKWFNNITGNTVSILTIVGVGTSTITAYQAATSQYTDASVNAVLTVSLVTTTLTRGANFGTTVSRTYDPASLTYAANVTSSRGTAVSYSSSDTTVATVDASGIITIVKSSAATTTTITASQAATSQYTDASLNSVLTVNPATTTLTRGANFTPTVSMTYNPASLTYAANVTSSRGTAVSYSSSDTTVATVDASGIITIVKSSAATTTTITASQAATSQYDAPASITSVLTVNPATTTLTRVSNFATTFTTTYDPANLTYTANVTSSRGTAVSYTSSIGTVASINAFGVVTINKLSADTVTTLTAFQNATYQYEAASITSVLTVNLGATTLTRGYDFTPTYSKTYSPYSLNYSANVTSSRAGTITYSSSNTSVATVNASGLISVVKSTSDSVTTITAYQAATDRYNDASINSILTVVLGTSTFSTSNFTVASDKNIGDASFSITTAPASLSTGAITYSSDASNVATIDSSGSIISIIGTGQATFTATQAATVKFFASTKQSNVLTVKIKPTLVKSGLYSTGNISKKYGDASFSLIATSDSSGGKYYSSDNTTVATVDNSGLVVIKSVGTAIISINQYANSLYSAPTTVTWTVEIAKGDVVLRNFPTSFNYSIITPPFYVNAASDSSGAISYILSDPSSTVATVNTTTGLVTLKDAGSVSIIASQVSNSVYNAPPVVTCLITVTGAGNALQGATIDPQVQSFSGVNLSGASLTGANVSGVSFSGATMSGATFDGATMTGATFSGATLTGASLDGANISNASFAGASMVGASLAGTIMTGASFIGASMAGADMSGAVMTGASFAGASMAGASLVGADISGASFSGSNLANVDLSGANVTGVNFTNANISGANLTGINFAPVQKLQLLKNSNNREINQVKIEEVTGNVVLSVVPQDSTMLQMPNIETAVFKVIIPETVTSPTAPLTNIPISDASNSDAFYLPINEGEYFKINNIKYTIVGKTLKNYTTNETVEIIIDSGKQYRMFIGSIAGVALEPNTLSSSQFMVPNNKKLTDVSFSPVTLPTSNSNAPIVYTSNNTNVATIDSSSGVITIVNLGIVTFSATQASTFTHEGGSKTSNALLVSTNLSFSLSALDCSFQLTAYGSIDASYTALAATDATSVIYVKLSDMRNVFKFQTNSVSMCDCDHDDLKYFVFRNKWPSTIKFNPSSSMMDASASITQLAPSGVFAPNKCLFKHDYLRFLSLKLFNTIHGVDLFKNESDLLENLTYWGENVNNTIGAIIDSISTTSNDTTMPMDASGNRYLTNATTSSFNISRELFRQIAAANPERFASIEDTVNPQSVPLVDNDSFNIKITVSSATNQNALTGVTTIPSRTYNMKIIMKSDIITNFNTPVVDSEMYPNSYSYSQNVTSIYINTPSVYNSNSPAINIPSSRYGFNGWYYTNTSDWVTPSPTVRNKINWTLSANSGSSKVSDLQFVRINLKLYNKTSPPYLTIYTTSPYNSKRTYTISNPSGLTNNSKYSFYINFNSYTRLPAVIGYTETALTLNSSLNQGSFNGTESILKFAIETDSSASYGTVEFTLSSVMVGDSICEKEYGFLNS